MHYIIKNGLRVAECGWVVIEGVEHYVLSGYVNCNPTLNQRAWNTTTRQSTCPECGKFKQKQLSLF